MVYFSVVEFRLDAQKSSAVPVWRDYIRTLYILQFPDPRKMQINLTGFLNGKNARSFMGELWDLLVSAQESLTGIPEAFLQEKKDQIKRRMVIIIRFYYIYNRFIPIGLFK